MRSIAFVFFGFQFLIFFLLLVYYGSVGGTIMLVVGLYIVLWGKKRESEKGQSREDIEETKEETRLECITQN